MSANPTIDDLWTLVQAQEQQMMRMEARIERQERELHRYRWEQPAPTGRHTALDSDPTPSKRRVTRAGLIKAAAAGAIGLAGAEALRPQQALASSSGDGDIWIGTTTNSNDPNTAANASTDLRASPGMAGDHVFGADARYVNDSTANINGIEGYGNGPQGYGVYGKATGGSTSVGVYGTSNGGTGVAGEVSGAGTGVSGGAGKGGYAVSGYAVDGGTGVSAHTDTNGIGVSIEADAGYGVQARVETGVGVEARTNGGIGIWAHDQAGGVGILASGFPGFLAQGATYNGVQGRGGRFVSEQAPIRLMPSTYQATPPTTGQAAGDFFVASNGHLYYYNGTAWKLLA